MEGIGLSKNPHGGKEMKQTVKFLTVVEIEVDTEEDVAVAHAQALLDAFRESTLPSENYGVRILRATAEDLTGGLLRHKLEVRPYSHDSRG